jgi:hypothetical protein
MSIITWFALDDLNFRCVSQGTPIDTLLLIQTEGGKTVAVTEARGPRGVRFTLLVVGLTSLRVKSLFYCIWGL